MFGMEAGCPSLKALRCSTVLCDKGGLFQKDNFSFTISRLVLECQNLSLMELFTDVRPLEAIQSVAAIMPNLKLLILTYGTFFHKDPVKAQLASVNSMEEIAKKPTDIVSVVLTQPSSDNQYLYKQIGKRCTVWKTVTAGSEDWHELLWTKYFHTEDSYATQQLLRQNNLLLVS